MRIWKARWNVKKEHLEAHTCVNEFWRSIFGPSEQHVHLCIAGTHQTWVFWMCISLSAGGAEAASSAAAINHWCSAVIKQHTCLGIINNWETGGGAAFKSFCQQSGAYLLNVLPPRACIYKTAPRLFGLLKNGSFTAARIYINAALIKLCVRSSPHVRVEMRMRHCLLGECFRPNYDEPGFGLFSQHASSLNRKFRPPLLAISTQHSSGDEMRWGEHFSSHTPGV
jgi:hypothetical protein